jgi:hypothetical protein
MKTELGMGNPEMKDIALSEAINLPSLNINGMHSGNVGNGIKSNYYGNSST